MPIYAITASATRTGQPLYLGADTTWTHEFDKVAVVPDEPTRDRLLAEVRRDESTACDAYWIELAQEKTAVVPVDLKERVRAKGPTIRFGEWK